MHEAAPGRRPTQVEKGTLEGNVRMPQASLGIAMLGAERCIMDADPAARLEELLAPVPLTDAVLLERTRKANAQHEHHGISIELKPEAVRRIEVAGKMGVLSTIGEGVGVFLPAWPMATFDAEGAWASPELTQYVRQVQEQLTPERVEFLRKLFTVIHEVIESPEVKNLLHKRKEEFKEWSVKQVQDRRNSFQNARAGGEDLQERLLDALEEHFPEDERTVEQRDMIWHVSERIKRQSV